MRWLDTNVVISFITGDMPERAPGTRELMRRLQAGEEDVETSEAIVAEVVYVLSSRKRYDLTHDAIVARLLPVLALQGLHVPGKGTLLRGLEVFAQRPALDFEDALSVARMERLGIAQIYSYDHDFDGVARVERVEP